MPQKRLILPFFISHFCGSRERIFSEIKQLHTLNQQRSLEIASKALEMQKGKDLEL